LLPPSGSKSGRKVDELRDSATVSSVVTGGSDNFTGWATLALAGVTLVLAIVATVAAVWTRKAAKATEDLAEGSIRPWITTHPNETLAIDVFRSQGPSAPSVTLRVHNVGQGLALVVPERTYMREYNPEQRQPEPLHPGTVVEPAIAPIGDVAETDPRHGASFVQFNLADRPLDSPTLKDLFAEEPPRDVPFLIDLEYTDAAGGQPVWARFHCLRPADRNSPIVTRIDYLHDEDGMPIVPAWISTQNQLG
jgi:hypothetical protein